MATIEPASQPASQREWSGKLDTATDRKRIEAERGQLANPLCKAHQSPHRTSNVHVHILQLAWTLFISILSVFPRFSSSTSSFSMRFSEYIRTNRPISPSLLASLPSYVSLFFLVPRNPSVSIPFLSLPLYNSCRFSVTALGRISCEKESETGTWKNRTTNLAKWKLPVMSVPLLVRSGLHNTTRPQNPCPTAAPPQRGTQLLRAVELLRFLSSTSDAGVRRSLTSARPAAPCRAHRSSGNLSHAKDQDSIHFDGATREHT